MPKLQIGDRVMLKVMTLSGYKGSGVVVGLHDEGKVVELRRDGCSTSDGDILAMRYEVSRFRNQKIGRTCPE